MSVTLLARPSGRSVWIDRDTPAGYVVKEVGSNRMLASSPDEDAIWAWVRSEDLGVRHAPRRGRRRKAAMMLPLVGRITQIWTIRIGRQRIPVTGTIMAAERRALDLLVRRRAKKAQVLDASGAVRSTIR